MTRQSDIDRLRADLDTFHRMCDEAEAFRATVVGPQILRLAAELTESGIDDIVVAGERHYLIDRHARVSSRKVQ